MSKYIKGEIISQASTLKGIADRLEESWKDIVFFDQDDEPSYDETMEREYVMICNNLQNVEYALRNLIKKIEDSEHGKI
tara:strand:+ start:523 stop:759 length:237 start_codon:yes stop_codon:yes gene_type:complete